MSRQAHAHEPEAETEDPRNRLLDAFDGFIDALLANDMGLQARERIKARFPELFAQPVAPAHSVDVEGELELAALITDCARLEKLRLSAASHGAIARMKARAKSELDRIQGKGD